MLEKLKSRVAQLKLLVKPTERDLHQFETNCRSAYMADQLEGMAQTIEFWKNKIGTEVFKLKKSFSFSEVANPDILNQTEDKPIVLTEELFTEFLANYKAFRIEHATEKFTRGPLTNNSTHKLRNLEFEWLLECDQKLLDFYKEL